MDKNKKIVIVGAGLAGALAAIYLAKRGYQIDVYEKRPDTRITKNYEGRSINLALSERGRQALRAVGVEEVILGTGIPMYGRTMHDKQGKLSYMPYGQPGQCIYSVGRQLINEVLMNVAEGKIDGFSKLDVTFHFEKDCIAFDPRKGILKFKDGETVVADVVIGTDGAASSVRAGLIKCPGVNYSQDYLEHGYKELCINANEKGDFSLPNVNSLHIWPRLDWMLIALPNPTKDWTVTLFMPWDKFNDVGNDDNKIKQLFDENFPDAIPLMKDYLEQYKKNPASYLATVSIDPWNYGGKCVVIGDAAHAVVPFFGQGMNASFQDVYELNKALDETNDDWDKAIPLFAARQKPNGDAVAEFSRLNYIDMRANVTSVLFLLRSALERFINRFIPSFIPKYAMVSFTTIPYAEVKRRHLRQQKILNAILFSIPCVVTAGVLLSRHYNLIDKFKS